MLIAVNKIAFLGNPSFFNEGMINFLNTNKFCSLKIASNNVVQFLKELKKLSHLIDFCIIDTIVKGYDLKFAQLLISEFKSIKIIIVGNGNVFNNLDDIRMGIHGYVTRDLDGNTLLDAFEQLRNKGYYHGKDVLIKKRSISYLDISVKFNDRELDILKWICFDLSLKQIAEKLYLSTRTVEGVRDALYKKVNVSSKTGLAIYAIRVGLISINDFNLSSKYLYSE
jgi:DNA-binding NarL/FixJ family response regulator